MCGFIGTYSWLKQTKSLDTSCIKHRGPDENVEWVSQNSQLRVLFCRLSMNGLGNGRQPLFSSNRQFICFVNGEVYNYMSLKLELVKIGAYFRTDSDCEVIPNIIQFWGYKGLNKIEGPFSVICYDINQLTVTLIRDALGEKPLYVSLENKTFVFGSELRALANIHDSLHLNVLSVNKFFHYGYVPGAETLFEEITEVPPGYFLTINPSLQKNSKRWYDPKLGREELDVIEEVRKSILLQATAEAPLCLALSGGVDSQIIARTISKNAFALSALTMSTSDINQFETSDATNIAENLGLNLIRTPMSTSEHLSLIKFLPQILDDAVADLASPFYFRLAQSARENGFKGILFGHGGDELDWGYSWTTSHIAGNRIENLTIRDRIYQYRKFTKIPRLIGKYSHSKCGHQRYDLWTHFDNFAAGQLIPTTHSFKEILFEHGCSADPAIVPDTSLLNHFNSLTPKQITIISLIETYVLENHFKQVDRLSMYHSVEPRLPFLSRNVFESFLNENSSLSIPKQKQILKSILFSLNPSEGHIHTLPKRGFSTPPIFGLNFDFFKTYKPKLLQDLRVISSKDETLVNLPIINVGIPLAYRVHFLDSWLQSFGSKLIA